MNFKEYLKKISEETTSGDIASVDNKLGTVRRCKKHKRKYCPNCQKQS